MSPRAALLGALSPALVAAIEELVADTVRAELERDRDARRWLTLDEAAERYRTTPAALRKRAQRGTLPGAVRDGARWLVEASELDRVLLSGDASGDNKGSHRRNGRARDTGGDSSDAV